VTGAQQFDPTRGSEPLSFRTIERLLDLPAGSARRRRLLLLTVAATHISGTELGRGDRLVIEPGAHASPGRLLICRCDQRIVLRRVRLDARGQSLLAPIDPQKLPFPDTSPCSVVGTVLGVVRAEGESRVRVAFPPRYEFDAASACVTADKPRAIDTFVRRTNSAAIERVLQALAASVGNRPALSDPIAATAARLRTLGNCLDVVDDERIYRALAREINTILSRLRRALATNRRWRPLQQRLRPIACDPLSTEAHHSPEGADARLGASGACPLPWPELEVEAS
jgi:hypothetical protein